MYIFDVCRKLRLLGELKSYELLTNGNINMTYHVVTVDENNTQYDYLLQRINKNVFKDPVKVMENTLRVTSFIESRSDNNDSIVLHFNTTEDGKPFVYDGLGNFWRARTYLDSIAFNWTDDLNVVEEIGRAFGDFQYLLTGFPADTLFESIVDFHNTEVRIQNLEKAIKYSASSRKQESIDEINYILQHKDIALTLCNMLKNKELPLKVTHNDTKCNNVIFNKKTLKALAVIDLDTIMPGLTAYDFGDGARSICCTTEEDEIDLSKVEFRLDKFERFTKGFLSQLKNSLTNSEISTLGISVYIMTLELASRFLEDYLNGDVYFKVTREKHNLIRTKCQLALAKDIYSKLDKINEIVDKYR